MPFCQLNFVNILWSGYIFIPSVLWQQLTRDVYRRTKIVFLNPSKFVYTLSPINKSPQQIFMKSWFFCSNQRYIIQSKQVSVITKLYGIETRIKKNKIMFALKICLWYPYLPTPPLGQDMTQGQFLSGV